jgi:hypothetical protein
MVSSLFYCLSGFSAAGAALCNIYVLSARNQKIKIKITKSTNILRGGATPLPRYIKYIGYADIFYSATHPCGERAPQWGAIAPQRPATEEPFPQRFGFAEINKFPF